MKIVIVDDDRLVTLSLSTIVKADAGIEVLATGADGTDAIALYERFSPDILLMDIRMQTMTGLEAAERILARYSQARILFLTTFADDEYIIKALKIGAKGYLLKQNFESIVPALYAVYSGQTVFGDDIIAKLPSLIGNKQSPQSLVSFGLTEKESEIIGLVAEGLSNREIAARLYLSEGTVRNSISIILDKLALRDRTQMAIFYYKTK